MSEQPNVFNTDPVIDAATSSLDNAPQVEAPTLSPVVSELVGEGKKFKDIEALAKSKLEADAFIEQLKGEGAEMRAALDDKTAKEELLRSLEAQANDQKNAAQHPDADIARPDANIVREQLNQIRAEEQAQANIKAVDAHLAEQLGSHDKAVEFVQKKAIELGVSRKELLSMAAKSPKLLYNAIGIDVVKTNPRDKSVSIDTKVNTTNFEGQGGPKQGSKAYYDSIRKQNKSLYFSPKVQREIFTAKKSGLYDS